MQTINITEIIQAVIYVLLAVASLFLIPFIRAKVGSENMADFLRWVEIGVAAAEQLYDAVDGTEKKKYVLAFLEDKGFTMDANTIDAAIEAAVIRLHNELYGGIVLADGVEVGGSE